MSAEENTVNDVTMNEEGAEEVSAPEADIPYHFKAAIELVQQNNRLLTALMTHPLMNREDPLASPKPLFFSADFVRRTYLEYLQPLLPRDAWKKSRTFANKKVFPYEPLTETPYPKPIPEGQRDEFLYNTANWPKIDAKWHELLRDCLSRTMMVPMLIKDADTPKGKAILGGDFDFKHPVDIAALTNDILEKGAGRAETKAAKKGGKKK